MKDYYATLHVLPTAEIDVIKAAYKALARKYHPDTWAGDKAFSNRKMQEINEAYEVIGDVAKRRDYDARRKATNQEDDFSSPDNDLDLRLEQDWAVASKYCPAAEQAFAALNTLSRSLAFVFKCYLLDTRQFADAKNIEAKFRREFLTNYFGADPVIQRIAELLISHGEVQAAKSVNKAVKVMGSSLSVNRLVQTLADDFPGIASKCDFASIPPNELQRIYLSVVNNQFVHTTCCELLTRLNIPYTTGFWSGDFRITYGGRQHQVDVSHMRNWVRTNLADHPAFRDIILVGSTEETACG